jgi:choline dehydrogenase-like flavoprotein
MFDQEMENYLGATGGQLLCQDGYDKQSDPGGAFGSSQWEIGLAVKPNDLLGISMSRPDIFGEDLHEFMREGAHYLGSMVAVVEDEPMPENRIELSENSDKFGMPRAKVFYQTSAEGRKLWHTVAAKGVEIMNAAGAQEGWHGPQGAQHIMGGTVLGRDPSKSVLDANAQSHDVSNLYVGGPSVFPTSSCINSTFTAHAVAMKSARHIVENWS